MMTHSEVPVNASQSNLRILWLPAFLCLLLLSIEIYLLLHDWDSFARPKTVSRAETIAVYVSGKKTVRQKSIGTLIWTEPVPNMALVRQSEIATTDDSEAVLRFNDQSELIVEPNSLLILEEAPAAMKTGNDKIVARLVRGSVRRKNSSITPFFVKLSTAEDAPAIQIQDTKGGATFRIIYRVQGYEIVVESGSVVVNQKETIKAGEQMIQGEAPKLSAPILKKPKVNIVRPHSQIFWNWLIPNANAADSSKLSIEFSWEATPDANGYIIQISKNQDFSEIIFEKKVDGLEYDFKMPAPQKKTLLYFRVAGISGEGLVGNYSAIESVAVNPDEVKAVPIAVKPSPAPALVAEATPALIPSPTTPASTPVAIATPSPTPAEAIAVEKPAEKEEVYTPPPFVNSGNTTWLWYGAQLSSRKFKSSSNPKEVSGSGFVPTVIGFDFQHAREPGHYYSVGGVFSYESAKPSLPAPSNTSFSTSAFSLWLTYGQQLEGWKYPQTWHFGPYFSTSKAITESGLLFDSKNIYLAGLLAAIQSDPVVFTENSSLSWRAQLAVLVVGTVGVDASAWLRKPLPFFPSSGAFWGLKANIRQSGVESSFGGSLQIGVTL